MTTLSLLNGDWEILFDDETVGSNAVAGLRMIREASGSSGAIYTTNELYSEIADKIDEFRAMGFKKPMSPVTPNAYTVDNKYFIPRRSIQRLKDGAITMDTTLVSGDGVIMKSYGAVTAAPVDGDIGRQVTETDTGDTGTLLDFETLPDGTTVIWIRPDTAADTFADVNSQLECTSDTGTMNVTATAAAVNGSNLFPSIQVIGAVPTATEVYIYQDRIKMTDYLNGFQWWVTDPTVSLGIIDILVRTTLNGTVIADGDVEVLSRRYTSLYDNFRLNVAAGGRSALPLASSPDINNTTGYARVTTNAGTLNPSVGDVLRRDGAGNENQKMVITAISGTTPNFTIDFYHVGDLTAFANTNVIEDLAESGTLTINSAESATPGGPTDSSSGEGGTVTIALGTTTVDHDGDGTVEPYSITVNAQSNVSAAKVYERLKYVTRRGADEADLFGAGVNVPGESYRGLEAQIFYDNPVGTFTEGDDITGASGYTARVISVNTTDTYVMLTDQQTSLDSVSDNDTLTDESADTVQAAAELNGGSGLITFTSSKQSPLGTFTGTQIFGARGVVVINPDAADVKNYILTDDNGTQRTPPNTITYTISNTVAGDRILVARDNGTAGIIDKDQFGGLASPLAAYNGLGDSVIRAAGSVDTEVPTSGYVRVVDVGLQQEHNYVYDSRTTGALGEFTLRAITDVTASAADTADANEIATLTKAGGPSFVTEGVLPGMLVRNTQTGKTTHVWEVVTVTDANNLDIQRIYGPFDATHDIDIGNVFEINKLIGNHTVPGDYGTDDNLFDLIHDVEATGTSEVNDFVKILASDFGTVVEEYP